MWLAQQVRMRNVTGNDHQAPVQARMADGQGQSTGTEWTGPVRSNDPTGQPEAESVEASGIMERAASISEDKAPVLPSVARGR